MTNRSVKSRIKNRVVSLVVAALGLTLVPALPAAAVPGEYDWFFASVSQPSDLVKSGGWLRDKVGDDPYLLVCNPTGTRGDVPAHWDVRGQWWMDGRDGLNEFVFGRPATDIPLCGDWNGDGIDTAAVVRGNQFFLASDNWWGGGTVTSFGFGRDTDIPVVGDWDGDGRDTIALKRGASYFFASENGSGGGSVVQSAFGRADDFPVSGDWDGDGTDTLALRRDKTFYITNQIAGTPAPAASQSLNIGRATDYPVSGTLPGDTATRVGLVRLDLP